MVVLEADKGYDCYWLRQLLLSRGIFPFIPFRKIRGRDVPKRKDVMKTFHLQQKRWQIERAFAWLKRRCRRLMTRWERKKGNLGRLRNIGIDLHSDVEFTWIDSYSTKKIFRRTPNQVYNKYCF